MALAMSKFLPTSGFKLIDPKKFDLDKYTSNCSKGCVLKFDLAYQKKITWITQWLSFSPKYNQKRNIV